METKIAVEESLLGPYLIADRIGQGGMATVYKAKRQGGDLQGTVVIKRMLPEHAHNPELVEMFRGEALLLASLKHTNIVQFLEFGLIDGVPYIVMEYLDGYDVAQILNRVKQLGMPFPVEAVVAIAREMCQGLGWAHEFVAPGGVRKQIIHRDVSPANVMVCRDGGIKLLDFGVAKITREFSRDITTLKGKYGYMAPEQVRGQPIDRRIDVFAAGVVLHEMLTCKRLFRGASWLETLREISAAKVRPPSETNPDVPPELDRLVMKALALKPDDRFASASEMGDALDEIPIRSMSHKKLAALLGNLFPDAWVPSSSPVEQTLVELADSDVEVIASVGPMPALSSREPTKSQRPRTDRPRRRRFTIATSAIVGTLSAVLAHFALNLTTRPAPPEIRYVPVAAAPPRRRRRRLRSSLPSPPHPRSPSRSRRSRSSSRSPLSRDPDRTRTSARTARLRGCRPRWRR